MLRFASFMQDDTGASAAEYVLILAIIGSAIAAAMGTFGQAIADALADAGDGLSNLDFDPT
jgi:pilus assembly protein Flp/PilA